MTSTIATAGVLLLTACGGGAGGGAIPDSAFPSQTSNPAPTTSGYGVVKASFAISPLFQDMATNANLTPFQAWFKKAHFWVTRAIGLLPSDQWNFGFPAVIPGGDRLRLLRFAAVEAAPSRGA